jgi:hypothetical protein
VRFGATGGKARHGFSILSTKNENWFPLDSVDVHVRPSRVGQVTFLIQVVGSLILRGT